MQTAESAQQTREFVTGACPHACPDRCALITEVHNGRAVSLSGDARHRMTRGWLCSKVERYLEWVDHPDRLLYPLRRIGGKGSGQWRRISWTAALTHIAERWRELHARYGGAAILPYSHSGTHGLIQMRVASERLWNRLGASRLQRSICGAAARSAVELTLGRCLPPDPHDLLASKLILIWGHNPAHTAPHLMPLLRAARRRGCKIVVIDPRRTATAAMADLHLQPRPGTDAALALGLMHVLERDGLCADKWLSKHTQGYPALKLRMRQYRPERVSKITGVRAEHVAQLAGDYGRGNPSMIIISDGLARHRNGGQTVRAITCMPALTGQYGHRGGGLYYASVEPLAWDTEAIGKASQCPPAPRTVNMNRLGAALAGEVCDPPIMSLYVFGANPAVSAPNGAKIAEGLQREDLFTVVHELFLTDTARYADVILPATSQLEQVDLHHSAGARQVMYNEPALAPRGEARSNWDTIRGLAQAMGFSEPWLTQDAEEIIEELIATTAQSDAALDGITLDRIRQHGQLSVGRDGVPFADRRFDTPSGKLELFSHAAPAAGIDPLPGYSGATCGTTETTGEAPLALVTAAGRDVIGSSLAPDRLQPKQGSPRLRIHPDDARIRGVLPGQPVIVRNDQGQISMTACVTEDTRVGVVWCEKGHWHEPDGTCASINRLASDTLGDLAGQSTFQSVTVSVEPDFEVIAETPESRHVPQLRLRASAIPNAPGPCSAGFLLRRRPPALAAFKVSDPQAEPAPPGAAPSPR